MPKNTTPAPTDAVLPGLEDVDRSQEERDQAFLDALAAEASNGAGDTSQNPDAQSSDTEDEELELSEENIHRLPKQQRALAREILKMRRENELLREQARPGRQEPDETDDEWEPDEWEIPDRPGFEELMPDYRTRMNYLYREVQALKRENDRLSQLMVIDRSQDHLSRFKRDVKDWKQYEQAMLDHAERMGGFPSDYDGLLELYETVRDRAEVKRLRQDSAAQRRAGPSPRVGTTRTASRERLQSAPANGKPLSIQEAIRQAARRMRQTPGML